MMDGAMLQSLIWYGYAQAANAMGVSHQLFRASGANNPTAGSPRTTLPAVFALDAKLSKPNKYGNALWQATVDGSQTLVGDYLVGPKTWFIAEMAPLLPIAAVLCNRVLNFSRPAAQTAVGDVGYGGNTQATQTPLMANWPGSILQGTRGEKGAVNLPGDVRDPWWIILLPATGGVTLQSRDIAADDLGRQYTISSAELTEMGWRLTALQAET